MCNWSIWRQAQDILPMIFCNKPSMIVRSAYTRFATNFAYNDNEHSKNVLNKVYSMCFYLSISFASQRIIHMTFIIITHFLLQMAKPSTDYILRCINKYFVAFFGYDDGQLAENVTTFQELVFLWLFSNSMLIDVSFDKKKFTRFRTITCFRRGSQCIN